MANVKGCDIMDLKYCDKTTPFPSPAKSTGQKHARNFSVWPWTTGDIFVTI